MKKPVIGSPKIIDPSTFPLEREELNLKEYKEVAKQLSLGKALVLEKIDGKDLVQLGQKYFLLEHTTNKILYYMTYQTRKIRGQRAVFQMIVWREAGKFPPGLAQHVMFDYLMPKADLITSDGMQTNRGAGLWQDFVTNALAKNYFVWAMDLNTNRFQKINTKKELTDLSHEIWTNADYHKGVLLGVSQKDLFSKTGSLSQYPTVQAALED